MAATIVIVREGPFRGKRAKVIAREQKERVTLVQVQYLDTGHRHWILESAVDEDYEEEANDATPSTR